MNNIILYTLITLLAAALYSDPAAAQPTEPLTTVELVDLSRYVGLWYEIAKIPNRFQKKCAANTTAEYVLREDGRIDVLNSCFTADGKKIRAKGVARIVDTATNAKLQVSFVSLLGMRLFWGDYWIIGLGENYEYAVIGHPQRKYGWILSRTPQLEPATLDAIHLLLREKGYIRDEFVMTQQ
ncbi:MAG TPA: lipocalin family protein [bacterium]|nr:lipocalin family protein [bacterium]HPN43970.1 lipocalin family protein [bacterium]